MRRCLRALSSDKSHFCSFPTTENMSCNTSQCPNLLPNKHKNVVNNLTCQHLCAQGSQTYKRPRRTQSCSFLEQHNMPTSLRTRVPHIHNRSSHSCSFGEQHNMPASLRTRVLDIENLVSFREQHCMRASLRRRQKHLQNSKCGYGRRPRRAEVYQRGSCYMWCRSEQSAALGWRSSETVATTVRQQAQVGEQESRNEI